AWLSDKAMGMAKGQLAKIGIVRPEQLDAPLPPGLTADVQVVQRSNDDGTTFNQVRKFTVVESDVPPADYSPDSADPRDDESEGDDEHLDAQGFNWRDGCQETPVSRPVNGRVEPRFPGQSRRGAR